MLEMSMDLEWQKTAPFWEYQTEGVSRSAVGMAFPETKAGVACSSKQVSSRWSVFWALQHCPLDFRNR